MTPPSVLSNWVRENRIACGLTQADLSAKLGITTVQISKIENGRGSTTLETLQRMCTIFQVVFVVRPEQTPN